MLPAREIITDAGECDLVARWKVAPDTIRRLLLAAEDFLQETGRRVWIISGWRSQAEQSRLRRQGRPTAADELSTHRSCPATGVDISLGLLPSTFHKITWGRVALYRGLWWGGRGPVDEDGIPIDWRHVDTGQRTT